MNTDEQERRQLRELAGAVADESPIDWDAELRSSAHFESKVRQLRLIESIASAYRSVPTGEGQKSERVAPDAATGAGNGTARRPACVPERWGSLEVREWLASGSFGEVYRAHDTGLKRDVALKLLHSARSSTPDEGERFLEEARRLAAVDHTNVLVVHGADRHDGRIGLWTELVRGKTLEDELKERGRYSGQEAALIGIDLCRALAAVHAKGLIHRDVKTANVMREEGGKIVLLDFSTATKRSVTRVQRLSDSMAGTPLFMGPEAFAGIDAGRRADIYSLGVVIYRLVTGAYPIEADSLTRLVEQHGEFRHTHLRDARPDLDAALISVVERAIHVDPERRFASMGEFEQALNAAIGVPDPQKAPPTPPPVSRRAIITVVAAVLAVVVGFTTWKLIGPPFRAEASLFKDTTSGPVALDQGANIQPEDRLFLELSGTRPMYVYVVSADSSGRETVLFPLEGGKMRNPLPADTVHELPGLVDGEPQRWEVTSADGSDSIILLASREQQPEIEAIFKQLPHAGDDSHATDEPEEGEDFVGLLRGIGGLTPARPGQSDGATDLMRSARRENVWFWEWLLANP